MTDSVEKGIKREGGGGHAEVLENKNYQIMPRPCTNMQQLIMHIYAYVQIILIIYNYNTLI